MAIHYFDDSADASVNEFETRRRIAAMEYEFDQRWEERPRRPRRPRRSWRRDLEHWR